MIAGSASRVGRCRFGAALAVLLLHGSGCGGSADEPPPAGTQAPAAPAPIVSSPGDTRGSPAFVRTEPPELPAPPEGSVVVWATPRGVTALAQRAPLRAVLEELAREAGFELELAEFEEPPRITLRAPDSRIEDVLAGVLRGIPYSLDFGPGPERRAGRLLRVRVGLRADPAPDRVAAAREPPASRDEADAARRALTAEEIERRAALRERLREEVLEQIEDPDAATRAEAAAWLEPDVEGLAVVERLLAEDPSPDVRAAAAESLAGGDSVGAVSVLLGALDDPDPRVVMAALDALEFAGDATIIPSLSPLLEHRDPDVRARTLEAIEFLE